jgi:hypothetical protein
VAHSVENADASLRDWLHADLCDFVQGIVNRCEEGGDTELAQYTLDAHRAHLDALREGREVRNIHRFNLPDWHPESTKYGGSPYDDFTLGTDDVLRIQDESKFVPPNRKERRSMGLRGPLNGQI